MPRLIVILERLKEVSVGLVPFSAMPSSCMQYCEGQSPPETMQNRTGRGACSDAGGCKCSKEETPSPGGAPEKSSCERANFLQKNNLGAIVGKHTLGSQSPTLPLVQSVLGGPALETGVKIKLHRKCGCPHDMKGFNLHNRHNIDATRCNVLVVPTKSGGGRMEARASWIMHPPPAKGCSL